jgi:two-component system, NarL family, response regulator LiaR
VLGPLVWQRHSREGDRADRTPTYSTWSIRLDAEDDFAVLGVAHDGPGALELTAEHRPAVLLLGATLPGSAPTAVKAVSPATKLLVLAGQARGDPVATVTAAAADGVLPRHSSSRQGANAIRAVVDGTPAIVMTTQPPRPGHDPRVELRVLTLSTRERELLGLLANGWSNRRIAQECFLSLNTVRTHMQSILVKLGARSKLEAVAFAYQHSPVPIGDRDGWDRHSA